MGRSLGSGIVCGPLILENFGNYVGRSNFMATEVLSAAHGFEVFR